jgi:hypothetical protein
MLPGLRVARIKLIFTPTPLLTAECTPLAYVEWFRPFSARDPHTGMFKLVRSTRQDGELFSQVIPVADIICSCLLQPVVGTVRNTRWNSEEVLDQCEKFYVDHYLHLLLFNVFHV